jgi:hypothetical protein
MNFWVHRVVARDFNTTLSQKEKMWGSIVKDPLIDQIEDLISFWDLVDINPIKDRFTWTNKHLGPSYILAILDRLLVQSSFLESYFSLFSKSMSWVDCKHEPILLQLMEILDYDPIPFQLNPL